MTCTLAVECLSLGDVTTSGKGAKTAAFSVNEGHADFSLSHMRVAFEPSAFQDAEATRVNIVFKVDLVRELELQEIDKWILDAVAADPVRFFGRHKTAEQLLESYTPCLKKTEKWGSQFKAKMNLPGSAGGVRVWGADKQAREPPESWAGCLVKPKIRFRHLYFMGNQWGPVIDVLDLQVLGEPANECPF